MLLKKYRAIVIGASAGGMAALTKILSPLPGDFSIPIVVTMHIHPTDSGYFIQYFRNQCRLEVEEAEEKSSIEGGHVYFAPPNYHLLVEDDETLSLSVDEKVKHSRPSVDVLFESAADVYGAGLMGIILTGANSDGTDGMKAIKTRGGYNIAQAPATAEHPEMPDAAIRAEVVDEILTLEEIGDLLIQLNG